MNKNLALAAVAVLAFAVVGFMGWVLLFTGSQPGTGGQDQLKKFNSYRELTDFLKTNREKLSYNAGLYGGFGGSFAKTELFATAAETGAVSGSSAAAAGSDDYSTTNIQVEGVDEADIVKNDGKYIYVLSGRKLVIVDAYPAEQARILSETEIEGQGEAADMLVNKDRLVVFGRDYDKALVKTQTDKEINTFMPSPLSAVTRISVYDISDREKPVLARGMEVSGYYYGSRMIGDYVYAVANQPVYYYEPQPVPLPIISEGNAAAKEVAAQDIYYFDSPDYNYNYINIISVNTQNDAEDYNSKTFLAGSAQNMYVSTGNIYVTYTKISDLYTMDNVIDKVIIPIVPGAVASRIGEIRKSAIESGEKMLQIGEVLNKYTSSLNREETAQLEERMAAFQKKLAKETEKTVVHKIAISNGAIDYKGQGSVPGHVLNQFSMDEHNGYLRIATTTTATAGFSELQTVSIKETPVEAPGEVEMTSTAASSPAKITEEPLIPTSKSKPTPPIARRVPTSENSIYVLDENLHVTGALEDMAPGESIYSARFIGNRAYLVTFRKIDPLFVIDLSEPASPKLLGKLKIPGYSDYLHPYDENHIIGIGKEAIGSEQGNFAWYQGVKLALFDVSEPENPKELSKYEIGDRGTDSEALRDHKAFLFDRQKNLLVIPVLLAEIDKSKYAGELPPYAYGDYTWQGAYVFSLDRESGFRLKGRITHLDSEEGEQQLLKSGYYFNSEHSVKRSLYMDNTLYTISDTKIKMNDLSDLREVNSVELPGGNRGILISY